MSAKACCYCGRNGKEMRPYGPNRADTCFKCAMKPENKQLTEKMYSEKLNRSLVVLLTPQGPVSIIDKN